MDIPRGTKRGLGQGSYADPDSRTGTGQMNITEGPKSPSLERKEWQATPGPQWEQLPEKAAGRCPEQLHPPLLPRVQTLPQSHAAVPTAF